MKQNRSIKIQIFDFIAWLYDWSNFVEWVIDNKLNVNQNSRPIIELISMYIILSDIEGKISTFHQNQKIKNKLNSYKVSKQMTHYISCAY